MTRPIFCLLMLLLANCQFVGAAESEQGYQADAKVTAATRIDWVYALANQSPKTPPADWLQEYNSTEQTFELFVPRDYDAKKSYPLVLFISPSDKAMGFRHWKTVCEQNDVIFAGPHNAGNGCETRQRVRIVLDVLDEVRRNYNVDVDRTYIGGFSGGGRIACSIAFSLPEYFGGVIPICAAGDLRQESWLRHRVIERLSVAHLTGESDFNRGEVERFRGPMLSGVGVRSRVWVVPKMGHSVPSKDVLVEAHRWLDQAVEQRRKLARQHPASRITSSDSFSRDQLSKLLFAEAERRMKNPKSLYSGLMQMKGVFTRWPDLPEAAEAKEILLTYEKGDDLTWEKADIAEQRLFLVARARALDAYATGPLPKQYATQRPDMARAAIRLWTMVIDDGQDKQAVADAKKHIPQLKQIVDKDEK